MVDLVVQYSDRAPESRIPSIAVNGLLVCFVCLGVLLLRHVAATKKVPALRVALVGGNGLLQELDSSLLALEAAALLMMKPAQLLQDLCVTRITFQNSLVRCLGTIVLMRALAEVFINCR